ncbi:phloretin 4'-O-glucosyltransferase [Ziziphus jujuba]|uniref:Glycosyltransferase n=1 Tax=Ziziphus jujuba TaxID=326968 RepID=A0A6P3YRX4_ZIZJJ|nr:phloretin 4'-O-glucosyltransferase [Ziziphus jujuba]
MFNPPRIIVVTYPAQGHLNPALQFSKNLTAIGAEVTFFTSLSAYRRMNTLSFPNSLTFFPFSDGHDDSVGFDPKNSLDHYMFELSHCGSQALSDLIVSGEKEGRPFCCVVYTLLLPWAGKVAKELRVPSALLWIQAATVFDIYYYYFHGYDGVMSNNYGDSSSLIELPGLPLKLTGIDLPSVMNSANIYTFAMPTLKDLFEMLDKEGNPKVFVNTFNDLEPKAIKAIGKFDLIGIGPLIPSAFLGGKDPSDTSFGGDLLQHPKDYYMEWLSSKPKGSVIYVSFGSMSKLSKPQMEEIGRALLDIKRPFLWVNIGEEGEDELSCREELEKLGMIVPWCSQMEILSNPSLGCFVTHCGWNSTLESLVCGIPIVGFPQWSDQGTNAKLVMETWKSGVRARANQDRIVEGDEIKKCLELVMGDGEKGEEIRRNAKKWKDLGREAAMDNGSSYKNLKAFLDEIIQDRN